MVDTEDNPLEDYGIELNIPLIFDQTDTGQSAAQQTDQSTSNNNHAASDTAQTFAPRTPIYEQYRAHTETHEQPYMLTTYFNLYCHNLTHYNFLSLNTPHNNLSPRKPLSLPFSKNQLLHYSNHYRILQIVTQSQTTRVEFQITIIIPQAYFVKPLVKMPATTAKKKRQPKTQIRGITPQELAEFKQEAITFVDNLFLNQEAKNEIRAIITKIKGWDTQYLSNQSV